VHSQSAMPPADAASTVIDVLSARMREVPVRGQDDARDAGLLVYLGRVPDRRRVRGRRHQLTAILALACGAVAAVVPSAAACSSRPAQSMNETPDTSSTILALRSRMISSRACAAGPPRRRRPLR
jgi:hypothetical protein